ncbi:MAG TPA: GGDEF domain-containing protein [Candidatus Saccharimonadales bacterium]|nr:GGDEF domain-containing protein [Candidatus Saccharimonadales bacterium]
MSEAIGQQACSTCLPIAYLRVSGQKAALAERNVKLESRVKDLYDLASTDSLTGLKNRFGLEVIFDRLRGYEVPIAVVFLDVEDFKAKNELYGHEGGDTVLRAVGRAFNDNLRKTDAAAYIMPPKVLDEQLNITAGRRGGDEFIIVAPFIDTKDSQTEDEKRTAELTPQDRAQAFAERIRDNFHAWYRVALEQEQADTPERHKIHEDLNFHVGVEVSEPGDLRTLSEVAAYADPDKSLSRTQTVPNFLPGARFINRALRAGRIAQRVMRQP